MARRRYGTFSGGIDLPDEKRDTLDAAIEPWPHLTHLLVPLAPCGRGSAESIVSAGQFVMAGQRIARAVDNSSVDIFAPLTGKVAGAANVEVFAGEGFVASPAIELVDLAGASAPDPHDPNPSWKSARPKAVRRQLGEGGLTTCRAPLEPLPTFLARAGQYRCSSLIANVMENQPYLTADHRLLVEHGAEVVAGLAILARAIEAKEAVLAADRRWTDQYPDLAAAASQYGITQIALPHKYPVGADPILVEVLTRREVPPGASTMAVGAAVVSATACLAAYRWVACGVPPTHRVVTVGGELADKRGNYLLPFGTPCHELIPPAPAAAPGQERPVIHNGPMTGSACPDRAVVTWATEAVLAIDTADAQPASPCIRCGWCTDHCPARLNVAALNDDFELGLVDQARRAAAAACVECGVCSYVCPARLPLTERVKRLKRAIGSAPASPATVGPP